MPHTIRTERLLLRPPSPRDARAFTRHCSDIDVTRMTARWPSTFSEDFARARFAGVARQDQREKLLFSILWQGEAIGLIGLDLDRAADTASLGYMSGKAAWGRGLMTEAVIATCRLGFRVWRCGTIRAETYTDNPASGRVLVKAGFTEDGWDPPVYSMARGRADDGIKYALTRERLKT